MALWEIKAYINTQINGQNETEIVEESIRKRGDPLYVQNSLRRQSTLDYKRR
jgi:hypothetical protein